MAPNAPGAKGEECIAATQAAAARESAIRLIDAETLEEGAGSARVRIVTDDAGNEATITLALKESDGRWLVNGPVGGEGQGPTPN